MSLWRFLRVCYLLLRGLYTAQRYTSIFYKLSIADLQIRILLAEDVRYPKAADIVAQSLGTHQPETVLLAHMLKFNCCCHTILLSFQACILLVSYLYPACIVLVSYLYPTYILLVLRLYPTCILLVLCLYPPHLEINHIVFLQRIKYFQPLLCQKICLIRGIWRFRIEHSNISQCHCRNHVLIP